MPTIDPSSAGASPVTIAGSVQDGCGSTSSALNHPVSQGIVTLYFQHRTTGAISTLLSTTTASASSSSPAPGSYSITTPVFVQGSSPPQLFVSQSGDELFLSVDGGNLDYRTRTYLYSGANPMTISQPVCDGPLGNFANGDFENTTTPIWVIPPQGQIISGSPPTVNSGTHALQINATAAHQYAYQTFAVQPDTTYYISGCVAQTGGTALISFVDVDSGKSLAALSFSGAVLNDWACFGYQHMTTGATTRMVRVYADMTAAGQYDYDDISVGPQDPMVVNGSFEDTPIVNSSYPYALGWQLPAQASIVSAPNPVDSGQYALSITATAPGQYALQQNIWPPPNNHPIAVSACYWASVVPGVQISVWSQYTHKLVNSVTPTTGSPNTWQCTELDLPVDAGAPLALYLSMTKPGQHYFDNVSMAFS